jgi:hypothetical protein
MSDKDSASDSYWYDVPPFPSTHISKKLCLVKFLEIPGHPLIGFSSPEDLLKVVLAMFVFHLTYCHMF